MTREEMKKLLPIMQAWVDGKTIQVWTNDTWVNEEYPCFFEELSQFRIKPESKYKPFKTQEECWNEMLKHQPFGWVKDEYKYVHILCVYKKEIEFSPDEDDNGTLFTSTMDFISVYEQGYTFIDGTPFGVKEEE